MKRGFSVEDTFLVWTEMYRAYLHHSSLALLNLQKSQKINHEEKFHQCNYRKIPHWRKLCDGICWESVFLFPHQNFFGVGQHRDLCGKRLLQAPSPAQYGADTLPGLSFSDSSDALLWLRWGQVLAPTQISKLTGIPARLSHIHIQTAVGNFGHRNVVSLQLWRHWFPQIWQTCWNMNSSFTDLPQTAFHSHSHRSHSSDLGLHHTSTLLCLVAYMETQQ